MEALQYIPTSYNELPSLSDAEKKFYSRGADYLVYHEIRQLFIDTKMDTTFGLTMLHRHFDLADNERLVEYNGTSAPWDISDRLSVASDLKPSMWGLTRKGLLQPYEFEFAPMTQETVDFSKEEHKEFVKRLSSLLNEFKADGIFGLVRYPGDDWEGAYEVTEGRANINLQPRDVDLSDENSHPVTASWFFSPALWGNADVKCRTGSSCKPGPKLARKVKICEKYRRADGSIRHLQTLQKSAPAAVPAPRTLTQDAPTSTTTHSPAKAVPISDPGADFCKPELRSSRRGPSTDEIVPTQKLGKCYQYLRADGTVAHKHA